MSSIPSAASSIRRSSPLARVRIATLDRVEAVDPYTVRFALKEPFGSFPIQLVMPVVPKGAGAASCAIIPSAPGRTASSALRSTISVELTAFPDYFRGKPSNDGVVLKVVPDEIMRGLELRKGTVDMVVNDLSPDMIHQLAARAVGARSPSRRAPTTPTSASTCAIRVLKDKRVRHALGYAIDRQAIVDYLRRGLARPAVGILPPASWAFDAGRVPVHARSREGARAPRRGRLPDPDGDGPEPRLRLSLKVSTNEFIRLQAAVIQQDLKQVGIDLDVRSYEFATLYADVLKGNFQLFTLQWVGVSDPDMLRRVFHSKQMPPNGFNRGYYENPEVDRLIDAAMAATTMTSAGGYTARRNASSPKTRRTSASGTRPTWRSHRAALSGVRLTPLAEFTFLKDVSRIAPSPSSPPSSP